MSEYRTPEASDTEFKSTATPENAGQQEAGERGLEEETKVELARLQDNAQTLADELKSDPSALENLDDEQKGDYFAKVKILIIGMGVLAAGGMIASEYLPRPDFMDQVKVAVDAFERDHKTAIYGLVITILTIMAGWLGNEARKHTSEWEKEKAEERAEEDRVRQALGRARQASIEKYRRNNPS